MNDLFDNFERIQKNDPEFHEIFKNFAYGEVFEYSTLDEKDSVLVTLASLMACQSPKAFKKILLSAINKYIAPEEVKELLYQSVPYIGFGRAHNFFGVVIKVFDKKGIDLPLENRSNTTSENRRQKGREIQDRYFGAEMIQAMNDNAPEGQKHFNTFLEGYCFGDFYTREGLNDQQRELITFTFIATLGGCENQLRGHTQGNLAVRNTKEKLVSAVTIMLPYIGFPRSLNALAIINEICE
ncbi:MAG: carboxymuconolactone decarboxylase family protein [Methanobrevibacter sp.]|uniref:carboxymuconolactone decarboxylase family protein n=1 Tax=Methanobrevibacter sp. TaxID=66852 RepID=UPI001E12A90E|nr:carboxymuconolactone decarboxylase family protein [Methanobrevibacter sp.]MBE6489719.1 carboxymuconolactone decarboxylase family protein [Methanobrevibacter sp.]MEE0934334.1 carboxymuconolactone decarboxylase family protein [Methanobrevibacter sp.]